MIECFEDTDDSIFGVLDREMDLKRKKAEAQWYIDKLYKEGHNDKPLLARLHTYSKHLSAEYKALTGLRLKASALRKVYRFYE